ncbi:hypothetical protein [Wenxinia marina]|uniref:hypothetical protein n=1 Tax=Wenxinia marina TaxID=390641 RepID=UPI0012E00891|nr:hypothetical protein [Wenxinia marina]
MRKFVCREFIKTVDLDLFRTFLETFPGSGGIAWSRLPEDEKEKREALFEIFQRSEDLTDDLQDSLHCAKYLAGAAGASKLLELAEKFGVDLVPPAEALKIARSWTRARSRFTPTSTTARSSTAPST